MIKRVTTDASLEDAYMMTYGSDVAFVLETYQLTSMSKLSRQYDGGIFDTAVYENGAVIRVLDEDSKFKVAVKIDGVKRTLRAESLSVVGHIVAINSLLQSNTFVKWNKEPHLIEQYDLAQAVLNQHPETDTMTQLKGQQTLF